MGRPRTLPAWTEANDPRSGRVTGRPALSAGRRQAREAVTVTTTWFDVTGRTVVQVRAEIDFTTASTLEPSSSD
jgi:hypothetical protein